MNEERNAFFQRDLVYVEAMNKKFHLTPNMH